MRRKKENMTAIVKTRLPEKDKEDLLDICRTYGLTESQALRIAVRVYINQFKKW